LARRTISFTVKRLQPGGLDKLLERLSRELKSGFARVEVRGDRLVVELVGDKASIRESIVRVRRMLREMEVRRAPGGLYAYDPSAIRRNAGISVPLDVLAEVLISAGYRASYTGEALVTDAEMEVVAEASRRVAEALKALESVNAATGLRKALAAASAASGVGVEILLEEALSLGVAREAGGRLIIKGSWRDSFRRLMESVERGRG
jgi:hypothetical protein